MHAPVPMFCYSKFDLSLAIIKSFFLSIIQSILEINNWKLHVIHSNDDLRKLTEDVTYHYWSATVFRDVAF